MAHARTQLARGKHPQRLKRHGEETSVIVRATHDCIPDVLAVAPPLSVAQKNMGKDNIVSNESIAVVRPPLRSSSPPPIQQIGA